jgi:hypothetical protein
MDAPSFAVAIETVANSLRNAGSVDATRVSLSLLVQSARNELDVLDGIDRVLKRNQIAQASIVRQLSEIASRSDISDHLAELLNKQLASFEGGPGAEQFLAGPIQALIERDFSDFRIALGQIPQLDPTK